MTKAADAAGLKVASDKGAAEEKRQKLRSDWLGRWGNGFSHGLVAAQPAKVALLPQCKPWGPRIAVAHSSGTYLSLAQGGKRSGTPSARAPPDRWVVPATTAACAGQCCTGAKAMLHEQLPDTNAV